MIAISRSAELVHIKQEHARTSRMPTTPNCTAAGRIRHARRTGRGGAQCAEAGYEQVEAYSPFPVHGINEALAGCGR